MPFPWLEVCQEGSGTLEALIYKDRSVLTPKCQTRENATKVPKSGTIGLSLGTLAEMERTSPECCFPCLWKTVPDLTLADYVIEIGKGNRGTTFCEDAEGRA